MVRSGVTSIEVRKSSRPRYDSVLWRTDGVVVALEGGSYNSVGGAVGRVPHDIAHFVVEELYGLERGLWGVLAAGGIVQNASFVGGRLPPHAMRRARAITDPAGESLRQAEVLVRATADLALAGPSWTASRLRTEVGGRWWSASICTEAVARACTRLREFATLWNDLPAGESVTLRWVTPARGRRRG